MIALPMRETRQWLVFLGHCLTRVLVNYAMFAVVMALSALYGLFSSKGITVLLYSSVLVIFVSVTSV